MMARGELMEWCGNLWVIRGNEDTRTPMGMVAGAGKEPAGGHLGAGDGGGKKPGHRSFLPCQQVEGVCCGRTTQRDACRGHGDRHLGPLKHREGKGCRHRLRLELERHVLPRSTCHLSRAVARPLGLSPAPPLLRAGSYAKGVGMLVCGVATCRVSGAVL